MKLKCIGGMANGKIIDVESHYRENDIVRVDATVEFKIIDFDIAINAFREGRMPESITVPFYSYKISSIHFNKERKVLFLIPAKWSNEEAVCYVLGA